LQSQDTLRALFEGITDGLYILNQDLTIHLLNQVEAARQGYRPAELVGKSYLEFPWVRETSALLDQIRASLQTGHETTWISPQHDTTPEFIRDREFRIYPIRNRLAQIEQVIVFAQDVSERRRWQASLFRSANLATVGQLAGSVAHQINNPLTITMTNSQLILMEAPSGGEVYELAGDILKAGQRIQNIVQNLLDFSNQETYSFTEADLIETIEGALSLVIRPLKKAKIEVTRAYGISPTLSASVSHLKLVWMNLFLNARDAMLNYALQPQLTIATTAVSAREVKVEISDNGRGLTRGELKQLFNPFFTTKPSGQALGLGLYLAHTIIERHRGRIRAFSEPGRATTFEVVLPLDHPGEG
jgi:PAS domain S-box-containing protein